MPTFRYSKLVRDRIPGWHLKAGHKLNGRKLSVDELKTALINKLHEESDEISSATEHDELIEEIGDVQQIVNDLLIVHDISNDEIQKSIEKKLNKKGGFLEGQYIESVTISNEDDEWAKYCRRSPEKYPEINL